MKSGLLLSFRVLFKNKLFIAINLINLIEGILACLLLLKYLQGSNPENPVVWLKDE